eukprot:SAG22_NODE_1576_length_4074_cov_3.474717_5_plen_132_part_00
MHAAFPLALLNTAVAEGISVLVKKVKEDGMTLRDAVADMYTRNDRTIFNGDGYSEEWNGGDVTATNDGVGDAERRGLLNLRTSVEAYDRTGQDRTGQDRTGQGRAGQGRAGHDRAGRDAPEPLYPLKGFSW